MNYTELYYEHTYGCYPYEEDKEAALTKKVFDYLEENIDAKKIMNIALHSKANKEGYLKIEEIPDELWNNSLLKRNVFYYHPILQIRSKAPSFDPHTGQTTTEAFYLEMRIQFTEKDLVDYIRRAIKMPAALYDDKRDIGSAKYLLDKYKKIDIVNPIDFVLFMADEMKDSEQTIVSILDIAQAESVTYTKCMAMVPELEIKKANRIVWRTEAI